MIGVVIPARDEERLIDDCVRSVARAARHVALNDEPVVTIVVCDDCSDATELIASQAGAVTLTFSGRGRGAARHFGARAALALGARWLCFTDADMVVADDWLERHLRQQAQVVCGPAPADSTPELGVRLWPDARLAEGGPRGPVHGANLSIEARLYRELDREPFSTRDDALDLVEMALSRGARVTWPDDADAPSVHAARPDGKPQSPVSRGWRLDPREHLGSMPGLRLALS